MTAFENFVVLFWGAIIVGGIFWFRIRPMIRETMNSEGDGFSNIGGDTVVDKVLSTVSLLIGGLFGYGMWSLLAHTPKSGPMADRATGFILPILIGIIVGTIVMIVVKTGFAMLWPETQAGSWARDLADQFLIGWGIKERTGQRGIHRVMRRIGAIETDHEGNERPLLEYGWASDLSPSVGSATSSNPAGLVVEKHPRFPKSKLESEDFWGGIDGVEELVSIETAPGDNSYWLLLFSDVEIQLPEIVQVEPYLSAVTEKQAIPRSAFLIGIDHEGYDYSLDFASAPNLLIAGGTGSGKSVLMNFLIAQALGRGYAVDLIDPDRQVPGWLCDNPNVIRVCESSDFGKALARFNDEMELRSQGKSELSPRILVTDETSKILSYRANVDSMHSILERARKQMMAVISVFQNPSSSIVPTPIRDNYMNRVIGRLDNVSQVASMFPGVPIAENLSKLRNPGEMLFSGEDGLVRVKIPFSERLEPDKVEGWQNI